MSCGYCRSTNPAGAHRCRRCGRPLPEAPQVRGRGTSSAMPAPKPAAPREGPPPRRRPEHRPPPHQPSLFEDNTPPAPKVIPIESIRTGANGPGRRRPPATPASPLPERAAAARRVSRKGAPGQQRLDLLPTLPPPARKLAHEVQAAIYCDAPVALPRQRIRAALIDLVTVLAAWTIFLAVPYFAGLALGRLTWVILAASFVLIFLFYQLLGVYGGETPGMRCCGLRLLDFDGRPPDRRRRLFRLASWCLNLLPAGFGLFWALVDDEHLAWHDHMSKTFPTTQSRATGPTRRS